MRRRRASRAKERKGGCFASALMFRSESEDGARGHQIRAHLVVVRSSILCYQYNRSQNSGPETLIEITGFWMVRGMGCGPRPR